MSGERSLESLLTGRRILVCVGCGGVGKTTVAAALALEAARRKRRTLVMTIDPARRLADALGVGPLGNAPSEISEDALARVGVAGGGALSAMMLDMKRTFDDLVERFAESAEARERIFQNRIYQHVSDALAGSAEYSAMEKVYELAEAQDYDLIVVDTPPSQHAVDFLEAPQRLLELLDSRLVKMLLHPALAAGRFGFRIFQRGTQGVLRLIERVSGLAFLEDVSEFLLAFEGMAEGFAERARRVHSLLLGPESAFVLVSGPAPESVAHAGAFLDHLDSTRAPLAGVVVNRARLWPLGAPAPRPSEWGDGEREALAKALGAGAEPDFPAADAARAAVDAAARYASTVERDAQATAPLLRRVERSGGFGLRVPELSEDVHDLRGLARVGELLLGPQS